MGTRPVCLLHSFCRRRGTNKKTHSFSRNEGRQTLPQASFLKRTEAADMVHKFVDRESVEQHPQLGKHVEDNCSQIRIEPVSSRFCCRLKICHLSPTDMAVQTHPAGRHISCWKRGLCTKPSMDGTPQTPPHSLSNGGNGSCRE